MSMTRKHFQALAEIVREAEKEDFFNGEWGQAEFVRLLADFCSTQNQNFDRDRFVDSCNVELD